MKTIKMPSFFHEVFGKRPTLLEFLLTLLFALGMSIVVLCFTYSEWRDLALWRVVVLAFLMLDIYGGVIANFSVSTSNHYREHPKARLIFIAIHVQPVLLALVLWNHFIPCLLVWGYTIASAFVVNKCVQHPAQRTIAAVFLAAGIGGLLLAAERIPTFLLITLLLYLLKVVYSFAVDHYAPARNDNF